MQIRKSRNLRRDTVKNGADAVEVKAQVAMDALTAGQLVDKDITCTIKLESL